MVIEDQKKIKDIPSSAVPHGEKKWCHIHQRSYEVYYTRPKNDEESRIKCVTRVWHCPECGKKSRYLEKRSRCFKKVPPDGTIKDKMRDQSK